MTIQAQSYGPIAGELINSGERLTVIAKFERSLYLECETGGLEVRAEPLSGMRDRRSDLPRPPGNRRWPSQHPG